MKELCDASSLPSGVSRLFTRRGTRSDPAGTMALNVGAGAEDNFTVKGGGSCAEEGGGGGALMADQNSGSHSSQPVSNMSSALSSPTARFVTAFAPRACSRASRSIAALTKCG